MAYYSQHRGKHSTYQGGRASQNTALYDWETAPHIDNRYNQPADPYGHPMVKVRKRHRHRALATIGAILLIVVAAFCAFIFYLGSLMSIDRDDIPSSLASTSLDEPFYMLLVGSDWRENSGITNSLAMSGDEQRADIMMLARVDRPNGTITLLTIPRDTPYLSEDGTYIKLNEAYNQSRGKALVPAVESLTGVSISHYAEVYFSDFQKLVDALGGIEVDVPFTTTGTDMLTGEEISLVEGVHHLNGSEAALLARQRHEYGTDQDMNRQSSVRLIVQAMVSKMRQTTPWQLPGVLAASAECIRTDLSAFDLVFLLAGFQGKATMYSGTGPYEGSINPAADGLWLCYQDPDGWSRVINVVDSGEDPADISYKGDLVTIAGTGESFIL